MCIISLQKLFRCLLTCSLLATAPTPRWWTTPRINRCWWVLRLMWPWLFATNSFRSPASLGREKRRTRKRWSPTLPSSEPLRERRRKTASRPRRRKPTWRTGSSTRTQSLSLMAMPRLSGTTIPQDSENSSECELLYLPNLSTFHFSSFIATSTTWESWLVVTSTFTSWKSKLCLYLSPDHENLTRPPF